jgi:hypothetical protein
MADEALNNSVIGAAERAGKDQKSENSRVFAKWLRNGVEGSER